ncbi:hypothetical protein ACWDGI_26775 [Streptomyces sp. NPDC001220]
MPVLPHTSTPPPTTAPVPGAGVPRDQIPAAGGPRNPVRSADRPRNPAPTIGGPRGTAPMPAPAGRPPVRASDRPFPSPLRRRLRTRRLLPVALAVLLTGALLGVVQQTRPAPYGDRLTPGPAAHSARARGAVVEAYDGRTLRWRYARVGRRPLSVLPARGHAIAVWDDGLVTDTDGRSVRWHRALPAAAGWLRRQGGTGVLRPLGRGILAVVSPARIAAYRTADGDLRWVLPAHAGCAFRPERAVRHGTALLVAQPCADGAWTAQLIAVDDLGRIAPHRAPLGNALPGSRPEHPHAEKALAPPR